MFKRSISCSLAVIMMVVTCLSVSPSPASAKDRNSNSLAVPISTGDFTGTFTIREFERRGNQVFAIGSIVGTRAGNPAVGIQQATVQVQRIVPGHVAAASLTSPAQRSVQARPPAGDDIVLAQAAACDILSLVLGPLHLDVLGLVVDLNQVILEITGETGAGDLLGNLLCALTGLLDPTGLLDGLRIGILNQVVGLLNRILGAL